MPVYFKDAGVWKNVARPFVKNAGVWKPADVYVKSAGVWREAFQYDFVPSNPPQVNLTIMEEYDGKKLVKRWVRVGVRTPGVSHDSDLKRIRVLTTFNNKMPTSQYGGTYTVQADSEYDKEPWSDWEYNGFGGHATHHPDSSVSHGKDWPRNPTATTIIPEGKAFFAAWSEDMNGNWSAGNFASVDIPKTSVNAPHIVTKEARFQPNATASYKGGNVNYGQLVQQGNPLSRGMWFHGNQLSDSMGTQGEVTVKGAQIFIKREDDDGNPTANVYLFRHLYPSAGDVPGDPNFLGITKLGTINKEEGKWFPIPASMWPYLKTTKGFGLNHKDPDKATVFAADYSVMANNSDNLRCGEVHVVWREAL